MEASIHDYKPENFVSRKVKKKGSKWTEMHLQGHDPWVPASCLLLLLLLSDVDESALSFVPSHEKLKLDP